MNVQRTFLFVLLSVAAVSVSRGQEVPVELPSGFSIRKVAGNDLVPDASAMTVDPAGNPIVSGPGYVRRLQDTDGDGVFDSFETLAATKGIAQGVWFDGKEMWLTVDGAIKRSVSKIEGQPFVFEDVVPITTNAEHGSHAIRRSPDGKWCYVICGNATEIRDEYHSLGLSQLYHLPTRGGFLMRFPADVESGGKFKGQIVCDGFRNAYDFDFDSNGDFFVFDSDGERDQSLPWYRPTRIFRMKHGDNAGWVSASWKRPASFFDMPELIGQLGRGSPTGVAVCDSQRFGANYVGTVFVGDWTFGRIGVGRRGKEVEIFAKPIGNFGFAITDLEFVKDGSMFVTTGGRGTQGALYRIERDSGIAVEQEDAREDRIYLPKSKVKFGHDGVSHEGRSGTFASLLSKISDQDDAKIPRMIRSLQLMLGGCDGDRMFAGHQSKSPIVFTDSDRRFVWEELVYLLARDVDQMEIARLSGMLQLKNDSLAKALAKVAIAEKDPVKRIHYLNCVAVAGGKLNTESTNGIADGLLRIRREIDAAGLPVDRNWKPRMQQLARELFRDMRIPEAIVANVSFGQPADIWIYESLPEIFRGLARAKIATKVKASPDTATRQQLQCISVDRRHSEVVRSFSDREEFRDVVVMSVYNDPRPSDKTVMLNGLDSFNLTVNKASLIGLKKLQIAKPDSSDFKSLMKLEQSLGWTNPEVSIRDQIVMLLQQWTNKSQGYQLRNYDLAQEQIRLQRLKMTAWRNFLATEHGLKFEAAVSVNQLLERYGKIDFSIGDSLRGKLAYKQFQCASCHDGGGQNSGPSLGGIASRFSRDDVLQAIVDPNDNVPDRYRAVVVATEDGQLFRGSVVYESMAGIMLATNTGEIVRIDAGDVETRRKSNKSLMPEGLLLNATDQEVADLWSYLSELK